MDSIFSLIVSSSFFYFSASLTIFSISFFDNLPLSFVIVIFSALPVPFSTADTFNIPLASISYVISICGTPRGAGGIPSKLNFPNWLQSLVNCLSPSNTWIQTPGWLSTYVVNVCTFFVGIVVFRGTIDVITPPAVSIPMVKGATSINNISLTLSEVTPASTAAWTEAPYATASSGFIDLFGSFPLKYSCINCWTLGILVDPPTSTTSCTAFFDIPESEITLSTGFIQFLK